MAIRPVDLQLAYMAAPQNAALLSHAQESPQSAQQAAQLAFAAELEERQEHVDAPQKTVGHKIRARDEGEPGQQQPQRDGRRAPYEDEAPAAGALGLAGDGEHFIDVTA